MRPPWRAAAPSTLLSLALLSLALLLLSQLSQTSLASGPVVKAEGSERTFITPEEASHGDKFGTSVALSADGQTALVGAPFEDGEQGQVEGPGAAWVFTRVAGQWQEGSELKMPVEDREPEACGNETPEEALDEQESGEAAHACRFGISVALSADGDEAVIGAPHARDNSGAVFIFTRASATSHWILAKELVNPNRECQSTNPNGECQNRFGRSVVISADGTTVLVGAPLYAHRAFVFTGSGSNWSKTAELIDPAKGEAGSEGEGMFGAGREHEGEGSGLYGQSVALSADGHTALVGAPGYPGHKGAVWVFHDFAAGEQPTSARLEAAGEPERSGETEAERHAREGREEAAEVGARFGSSVALSGEGTTALVGGAGYEGRTGAAWAFASPAPGAGWSEGELLTGDGEPGEEFGAGVALAGDGQTALIGAMHDEGKGTAQLFERSGGGWTADEQLEPSPVTRSSVKFGSSVALSFDGVFRLVGGRSADHKGGAWIFGPGPSVDSVTPNEGPTAGGTTVTIAGEHLAEATAVRFGDNAATSFKVTSGKTIEAVSPSGAKGAVDVTVETPIGVSAPNAGDRFTYADPSKGGKEPGGGGGGKEPGGGKPGKAPGGEEPSGGGSGNGTTNTATSTGTTTGGASQGRGGVAPFGPFTVRACGASLANKKIAVRRYRALVELRGTGAGRCNGKLALRVLVKVTPAAGSGHTATAAETRTRYALKTIGTAKFSVASGKKLSVLVKLNAFGRRLFAAHRGRLNASLSIVKSAPAPAQARTASVRLTQLHPRRSRAKT